MENLAQNKDCNAKKEAGYIYILTNPAMPHYIKIGMTTGKVEDRVRSLNDKACLPFSFQIYATYKVNDDLRMVETSIHNIIDKIDYNLRAREKTASGKLREREFFALSPDVACSILEEISKLRNDEHNLKKELQTREAQEEENIAKNIERELQRQKPLPFSGYGIPIGSQLVSTIDANIIVNVVSETKVEYQGERYSLSRLALKIAKEKNDWKADTIQGPAYFMYNGKRLSDIREELLRAEEELQKEDI